MLSKRLQTTLHKIKASAMSSEHHFPANFFFFGLVNFSVIIGCCNCQHCSYFHDIAQEKSWVKTEQKDNIVRNNEIENIKSNLNKNTYPLFLIDKVIKKYLDYKFSSNQNQLKDTSDVHYTILPCIGNLSHHIKNKLSTLCKEFYKENFNIKLFFSLFKI